MSEKKGVTINDLASHLLLLIKNGEGDKIIKVSVTYDDCEHVQNLTRMGNYKENDFITLRGGIYDDRIKLVK